MNNSNKVTSETCPYPAKLCGLYRECIHCSNEEAHVAKPNDLSDLRSFFKEAFPKGIQMFNTHNITGDYMTEIYSTGGICVLFAPGFGYVEVFGLDPKQFEELEKEFGNYSYNL